MSNSTIEQIAQYTNASIAGIKRRPELHQEFIGRTSFLPETASFPQRLWHFQHNMFHVPVCSVCSSNPVKWVVSGKVDASGKKQTNYYSKYCCHSCRAKDPGVEEKRVATCISRYGIDKSLTTADHAVLTRQSCLEANGVEYPLQHPTIRAKTEETLVAHYGEGARAIIQDMAAHSLTKEFGEGTFGEKMAGATERTKANKTRLERWVPERLAAIAGDVELIGEVGAIKNRWSICTWKCVNCDTVFDDSLEDGKTPRCTQCFPLNRTNWKQTEVLNFVRQWAPEAMDSPRNIISPKELDIFVPSLNLAIEFNGLYWHSECVNHNAKTIHLQKTTECEALGIRLLHVFEDEWKHKRAITESVIKRSLGVSPLSRIPGRKCLVRAIDRNTCNKFLTENHLQGGDLSSVRYGIFYGDALMGVMTFGKSRYSTAHEWELIRLSFKIDVGIIGGAERLFAAFIREHQPNSIVTYSDRRLFTGSVYGRLGFEFIANTAPNYFYVNNQSTECKRFSRIQFQKHKLADKLVTFDPTLTEAANMNANGFSRIWDCGHSKWEWTKKAQ